MPEYVIRESSRARTMRVSVYPDGRVVVTKPVRLSTKVVERFVRDRKGWIQDAIQKMSVRAQKRANHPKIPLPRLRRGTLAYKEAIKNARTLITGRVQYWSRVYGFSYGTITIRNQKSRWGSCTKAGNLSFNVRLVFLPPELVDYIVIHELCHTKEHNHSESFWHLVRKHVKDSVAVRKKLGLYSF